MTTLMTVEPAPPANPPVDISNCDQEPIHIPGFIQPHGMLFALREPELLIVQASDNTLAHLGQNASELLGAPLSSVLDGDCTQPLLSALENGQMSAQPLHVGSVTLAQDQFHLLAHRYDGLVIVELERAVSQGAASFQNLYALVGGALA
ncbi:MAG: ATPase, partial [Armatimonadetes bacterium]|nr:ATPase [Armatimonadota bacterium]